MGIGSRVKAANDPQERRVMSDQLVPLRCSEGSSVPEEVDCLEKAGLARGVLSDDARRAGVERESRLLDAAKILDLERAQHIGARSKR